MGLSGRTGFAVMKQGDFVSITEQGKQAFFHGRGIRPADVGVVLAANGRTVTVRPVELPFAEVLRHEEVVHYGDASRGRIEGLI